MGSVYRVVQIKGGEEMNRFTEFSPSLCVMGEVSRRAESGRSDDGNQRRCQSRLARRVLPTLAYMAGREQTATRS